MNLRVTLFLLALCVVVNVLIFFFVRAVFGQDSAVQVSDDGRIVHWYSHEKGYCVADGDGYCDEIPAEVIEQLCER